MSLFYGVDIGGTSVKTALVAGDGAILAKDEFPTNPAQGVHGFVSQLYNTFQDIVHAAGAPISRVAGIGLGVPAFLDASQRNIIEAVNLNWHDVPLADAIEAQFQLPVAMDNDANVAALGESWRGAGIGKRTLLCATVGTGVGGGIVMDGRVHRGANGMAGEIGHLIVQKSGGLRCNCGHTGCLETVASATGIVKAARARLEAAHLSHTINGAIDVFKLAEAGVSEAQEVILEAAEWLGYGLSLAANTINPDGIVIGGGVSKAKALFLEPVRTAFIKYSLARVSEKAEILAAQLGNDAGVVGAARLIQQQVTG